MGYREIYSEDQEFVDERYELVFDRILEISGGTDLEQGLNEYFTGTASFLKKIDELLKKENSGELHSQDEKTAGNLNHELYKELIGDNYKTSFGNYDYLISKSNEYGKLLCFLYSELRAAIPYAYEGRKSDITLLFELFVQIYSCFEDEEGTTPEELTEIIKSFYHDNSEIFVEQAVREVVDPELDFFTNIVMNADLNNLAYLYRYGEYIDESVIRMARFLNSLSEDKIKALADTYTEGYRIGFEVTGKDLSKKRTVDVRYPIGMERVVRQAIINFDKMGLKPTIYRSGINSMTGRGNFVKGVFTKQPNRQYDFDHKNDKALYLDKSFVSRRLEVLGCAYEKYDNLARVHAGPAVIETFGETPFNPVPNLNAYSYDERQQELNVSYASQAGIIVNEHIPGDERSFTIIAFPTPDIGERFEEIFDETVKVNTLDYKLYQKMQQRIIDELDQSEYVRILGKGDNKTDMTVCLHPLDNPQKETRFENCVADVNIPVGEVFTSPVLKGTTGLLHVSHVFLNELFYKNLKVTFEDGKVTDYSCANFESEEEGRKYIHENVLFHHDTLPIGEFAIGTNTVAYKMARDYNIESVLPILIAEKTGPHFAVGDTCYSHCEDVVVYNPDGKEIVARDNEISLLRKEDMSKAYFNCHTDITIPYDELDSITGFDKEGNAHPIIANGRFVVEGCDELNKPLE